MYYCSRCVDRGRIVKVMLAALLALAVAVPVAAANPAGPPAGSWAGTLNGGSAFVGIVVAARPHHGVRYATAYVCDGKTGKAARRAHLAQWFLGPASARHFTLTSKAGYRLTITLTATTASGTLTTPAGKSTGFHAARAHNRAGLYRTLKHAHGHTYIAGLILLANGKARGAVTSGTTILTATLTTTTATVSTTTFTIKQLYPTNPIYPSSPIFPTSPI